MTDNIIDLTQHQRALNEQVKQLEDYINDGTLESMMVEHLIRTDKTIGVLIDIIETQQGAINSLTKHVNDLRKWI
ncbi:hypothetical protein JavanS250_0012 [Streptococcus satellite phage Javan250]|uniref:hypothetical protein n=1 Tax=Streptococcus halotolerans TaxID=1814128 RepID=UPI0007887A96|nr:hypothetical protein [Streptococcus halotolerans]QBX08345.1 hypothetical protein JavanS250_0012 [Streptococcus satellite phage Javan250]